MRYGEGAAKLEGAGLSKFASGLKEYFGFFDKVNKRLRDEKDHRAAAQARSFQARRFRRRQESRAEENREAGKELKKLQKEREFKSVEARFDEEHNLGKCATSTPRAPNTHQLGAGFHRRVPAAAVEVQADRTLHGAAVRDRGHQPTPQPANGAAKKLQRRRRDARTREGAEESTAKPVAKKKAIETEVVEKTNARDLFDYVKEAGSRKDYDDDSATKAWAK